MSKSKEKDKVITSQCFIGGTVQSIKVRENGGAFVLVDVGETSRWIPCDVHEEPKLAKRLSCYDKGDYIALRGFVRAWSQRKKDDVWVNQVTVRITEIKSEDPERKQKDFPANSQEPIDDDDIPF